MCIFGLGALLGVGGAATAGATAAGATAAATTAATGASLASTLSTLGTVVSTVGALAGGIQGAQAAQAQADAITQQQKLEQNIAAITDQRERIKFSGQIAQQRAELAARGVTLDSVTAVALGQTAAQEMSFNSQSIRAGAAATDAELSAEKRNAILTGQSAMLRGSFGAAAGVLNAAPDLWPNLSNPNGVMP